MGRRDHNDARWEETHLLREDPKGGLRQAECGAGGPLLGQLPAGKSPTVAAFLDRWLEHEMDHVRPRTWTHYLWLIKRAKRYVGRVRLDRLTAEDGDAMLRRAGIDGLSSRSVHHLRAVVRNALDQAVRWQLIARNPMLLTEPVPVRPGVEAFYLEPADAPAVLAAVAGDPLLEPIVTLASYTGMQRTPSIACSLTQFADTPLLSLCCQASGEGEVHRPISDNLELESGWWAGQESNLQSFRGGFTDRWVHHVPFADPRDASAEIRRAARDSTERPISPRPQPGRLEPQPVGHDREARESQAERSGAGPRPAEPIADHPFPRGVASCMTPTQCALRGPT